MQYVCAVVYFVVLLFSCPGLYGLVDAPPMRIAIFSVANGKGLELDRMLLKKELESLGHKVIEREFTEDCHSFGKKADVNIFFERINLTWLSTARHNWFVPNAEWYLQDPADMKKMDLILCRTKEAERIFGGLGCPTYFLGFTSLDSYNKKLARKKDMHLCLHVAGGSPFKGTEAVVEAWRNQPTLPRIRVIRHALPAPFSSKNFRWISQRLEMTVLERLQNISGIHVCPSQVEGYGHYIMEALAKRVVVVTTDAPPMNEFVSDERCLVRPITSEPCLLGTRYFIDPIDLRDKIAHLVSLPEEELRNIARQNRMVYLRKTAEFRKNLRLLLMKYPKKKHLSKPDIIR